MKECKLCTSLGDADLVQVCYPMPALPKIHNGTQEIQGSLSRFEYEAFGEAASLNSALFLYLAFLLAAPALQGHHAIGNIGHKVIAETAGI